MQPAPASVRWLLQRRLSATSQRRGRGTLPEWQRRRRQFPPTWPPRCQLHWPRMPSWHRLPSRPRRSILPVLLPSLRRSNLGWQSEPSQRPPPTSPRQELLSSPSPQRRLRAAPPHRILMPPHLTWTRLTLRWLSPHSGPSSSLLRLSRVAVAAAPTPEALHAPPHRPALASSHPPPTLGPPSHWQLSLPRQRPHPTPPPPHPPRL